MRNQSLVTLFLLATGLSTLAGSGPYFNTYTHNLEVKEWELEIGADAVRPAEGPWQYGEAIEIEHGFNEHFNAGLYLLGSKTPGEPWRVDGYKLETRYRPWPRNSFVVPTFYLEYEQFHHHEVYRNAVAGNVEEGEEEEAFRTEHEAEARLIFSQDFNWGNVALNLVAERSLDGGKTAFGYSGGVFFLGPSSGKGGPAAFDPDNDGDSHFLYGVELFGGLGEEGAFGLKGGRQEHYVQPFAAWAADAQDRRRRRAHAPIGDPHPRRPGHPSGQGEIASPPCSSVVSAGGLAVPSRGKDEALMRTAISSLVLMVSSLILAQQSPPPASPASEATSGSVAARGGGSGKEAWPEAIEDNSFLIEEAYNQEEGVVQWIFGGLYTHPNNLWAFSFTNEWPVPRETHQLSYTATWTGTGPGQPSGLGDLMVNYRYQLCMENKCGVAIAPRLSVILPAGDWREGLGLGTTGWQTDLPLSKRVSRHFALHFNAGATYYPSAKSLDADGNVLRQNLWGFNEGASVIWLASPRFNLMLEAVAFQQDQFSEGGGTERTRQVLISPGFRYAFNLPKGQLVVGAAVPTGLTRNSPHSGVFLYLSWEAPVWKAKK